MLAAVLNFLVTKSFQNKIKQFVMDIISTSPVLTSVLAGSISVAILYFLVRRGQTVIIRSCVQALMQWCCSNIIERLQ